MARALRKNSKYEILTPSGWSKFDGIKKRKCNSLIALDISGVEIVVSDNHQFKIQNGKFVFAGNLQLGDVLISGTVKRKRYLDHQDYVYDPVNVEKNNEYFSNGLISHNCEFLGSDHTLIDGEKLRLLTWKKPLNFEDKDADFHYWDHVIPDHSYAITVDVARGLEGDYSAFIVFDITTIPYKMVGTYRSNTIDPYVFPAKIARIAHLYNDAFVLVEINDNGAQVADLLHYDLEYPNMFIAQVRQNLKTQTISGGHSRRFQFGLKQSAGTKRIGCTNLKSLIEKDKLIICDHEVIKELATFVADGPTFKAAPGCHDDLAMCLVMFGWLTAQRYFREQTKTDIVLNMRNLGIEEQNVSAVPVGIMDEKMINIHSSKIAPYKGKLVDFAPGDLWFDTSDSEIDNPIINWIR